MGSPDPTVSAAVHMVGSQYHKSKQDFAAFYKSTLLYLAYTSVDSIPEQVKLQVSAIRV